MFLSLLNWIEERLERALAKAENDAAIAAFRGDVMATLWHRDRQVWIRRALKPWRRR